MQNRLFASCAAVVAMFSVSGCRLGVGIPGLVVRPGPVQVRAEVAPIQIQVAAPAVTAGVTVVESSCVQGSTESCDGLDNNCNGQIDEGCGYGSGAIQITVAWNTLADMDMYVTDPSGTTISWQNQQSPTGGVLDHDARGNCRPNDANNRIENVFWNTPTPPSGNYQVDLHYWGDCHTGNPPTTATVSIAVGGRIIGAYNYTFAANQRSTIATFNIP